MNETEQNLMTAIHGIAKIADPVYKIYHDAQGLCTRSDIELFDEPYIIVDRETFNEITPCLYRIVNGQLKLRTAEYQHKLSLIPTEPQKAQQCF